MIIRSTSGTGSFYGLARGPVDATEGAAFFVGDCGITLQLLRRRAGSDILLHGYHGSSNATGRQWRFNNFWVIWGKQFSLY
jgi:hypothetical protein